MTRLTRYVVSELLRVFLLSLTVMTTIMVLVFLVQEGWRENLTPATILELVPYTIPTALSFAIPGTILFATTIVYGRMSASNEIVALKAMGVSPTKIIWPGLIIAFALSLVTVYLNDVAVSWGRRGVYRVVLQSSAKTIYSVLNAQGSFNKGKLSIVVDDVRGEDLINPTIERHGSNGESLNIQASLARIKVEPETNSLIFQLQNGRIEHEQGVVTIDRQDFPFSMGDVTKKTDAGRSPSNLPLRSMKKESLAQNRVISTKQKELALMSAFQLMGGNLIGLTHPNWQADLRDLDDAFYRRHRLKTEPWRRWANGFSCLCFVIVGAPLAIWFRKFDFWSIFALCFIPVLIAYYPLLMFGLSKAKSGEMPPQVVWMGNAVMICIGLWLIMKIERR